MAGAAVSGPNAGRAITVTATSANPATLDVS